MIKSKKQMFLVICVFALVLMIGTISYALFNYTRTGAANTINVGRISFSTNQTKTISLSDVFPISSTNVLTDTDNVGTLEIEITGDTDYSDGIEYLVTSENAHVTASDGTLIPVSLDVSISNLGTENSNYFSARNSKNATIYKKLAGDTLSGDQMLLAGYIMPNTTQGTAEGINGKITIRAYFDADKIAISNTYDGSGSDSMGTTSTWVDGRKVLTTSEWNSLSENGISFQVKVEANEGIWVNERDNFEIAGSNFITMLNNANTTSKYEVIRNVIEDDNAVPTWFISTDSNNFSINNNGVVTVNLNNTLKDLTIGATVSGKTVYKNIDIDTVNNFPTKLLDEVTIIENEYAGYSSGNIFESTSYIRTDYIEIDNSKTLFFNTNVSWGGASMLAFYNENNEFISGFTEDNRTNLSSYYINGIGIIYGKIISVPENVKYMILSMPKNVYNSGAFVYFYIDKDSVKPYDVTLDFDNTTTLDGLNIVSFGDSIFGNYVAPNDIPSYISSYFGSENYNVAFGGTRMSQHSSTNYDAFSMYRLVDAILSDDYTLQDSNVVNDKYSANLATLKSIDFSKVDYVTIGFGTNDYGKTLDSLQNPLDTNTFVGATRYSINKLKEINANMNIILLTPIYRFWSTYSDASNNTNNLKYFIEYGNALKKVAMEYDNVYLFDGYNELEFNATNTYLYFNFNDKTHPNENGIKLYAYKLGKFIENLEHE